MKKIFSLLLVFMTLLPAWAQGGSGEAYDPSSPPEPQTSFRLTVNASPEGAGSVSPSGSSMQKIDQQIRCEARANEGYEFEAWRIGDEVVSTDAAFYFTMEAKNTVLTAWFKYKEVTPDEPNQGPSEDYNPDSPDEPFKTGYRHTVRVYTSPSTGGWVSPDNFWMIEGEKTTLYANPHDGFKFSCWKQDGKIISVERELPITMGKENLEYTAQFVYDPSSPSEPFPNLWNKATGELIIDRFTPGRLWDVISSLVSWEDYDKVTTLIVVGPISDGDFGVCGNFPGLVEADFSRTSGATYVPWGAFSGREALTKVALPSSISRLDRYAFQNCPNLSELSVYAVMPPEANTESFSNIPSDMVVKVYSESIDLYESASIWKNYKIMTLDEDATSFVVYLPEDAADGRYKNASLQLNNLSSGQSSRLIVTSNRTKYIFGNLIPNIKYSLYALSPQGYVLGKYIEIEMPKEGLEYTFEDILPLQELSLSLLAPDGTDLVSSVSLNWYDHNGTLLGNGPKLSGQVEGYDISYEISLPKELALQYILPEKGTWKVKNSGNDIKVNLKKLETKTLSGTVTDAKDGKPVAGAFVTVSQTVNNSHQSSRTVATDSDGKFAIAVFDCDGSLTAGAKDYAETIIDFASYDDAAKSTDIKVNPLTGTEITLMMNSRDNIVKGSLDNAFTPFDNYTGVEFTVKNLTSGKNLEYNFRYPKLIVTSGISNGDRIEVRGVPSDNSFKPATAETVISNDKGEVKLSFITDGDIVASYSDSEAEEVVGLLYDSKGILYSKENYSDNRVKFATVTEGSYTLVTMAAGKIFSGAGSLTELETSQLESGKDYLVNKVTVEEGYITNVALATVPVFDETVFYYTGKETTISVNKKSVTVGNTVTVRSKVDFLPEYSGKIEKVNVIFTIPDGCEYVENSLLVAGEGANFTTLSDGRLSVEMPVKDASPRFCIIPRKSGDYRPSAMIEFEYEGKLIRQPIGSTHLTASDFSISVPARTSVTEITARGTATPLSEIRVYDNDVYVGSARSMNNGEWRLKFNMFNPGETGTEHYIYAAITTPEGLKYKTETGKTLYDVWMGELTDIVMVYDNTNIDFNYMEAETLPASYTYNPGNDMFTLMAQFRDGHGERLSRLDFIILLSDGSRRRMSGKYLIGTETWTCALAFPDVNRLPVNVKVIYKEKRDDDGEALVDNIEEAFRCPDVIPIIDPSGYVYEAVPSNRLEGVTATISYREWVEDMYGDVSRKAVKWDAESYAQENPLFTDENGMYQWDVPSGEWQVRFEKEGYDFAQTEWLPVPPPQLDVNIGMVQTTPPVVKNVAVYPQSVDIEFDKFMEANTLTLRNISVAVDGNAVTGSIRLLDAESVGSDTYASAVRFEADEPFASEDVKVTIASRVKSYAGVTMEETFGQEFSVEPKITAIVAPASTKAYVGYDKPITVKVEPLEAALGKTLTVTLNTPILSVVETAELDEEGKAVITLHGDLPGKALLKFGIQDVYITEDYGTEVNVDMITAELPEASVESGTPVYRNTTVEIFTDSRIGEIYYTVDGTDPTPETGILYTSPVLIPEETEIRAINVIDDKVYDVSEVAVILIPLKTSSVNLAPESDGWLWISHNLENNVKVSDLSYDGNVERILGKRYESVNDPQYGLIGMLEELSPYEAYKIQVANVKSIVSSDDTALNPTTPVPVYSGWNWISYPVEKELEVNDAFAGNDPDENDMIVGQEGFATFNGEKWIGDLVMLERSKGYMYFSGSLKDISYNAFGKTSALRLPSFAGSSEAGWNVDRMKYAHVMPVIADVILPDGRIAEEGLFEVGAFCSEECRGVGVYADGYLFITVYGNLGDEISFRLIETDSSEIQDAPETVSFSEEALGTLSEPFRIGAYESGIMSNNISEGCMITIRNGRLFVVCDDFNSLSIYDVNGINVIHTTHMPEGSISLENLSSGIYVVTVNACGKQFRQKMVIR